MHWRKAESVPGTSNAFREPSPHREAQRVRQGPERQPPEPCEIVQPTPV
jgi:hypothetical protein